MEERKERVIEAAAGCTFVRGGVDVGSRLLLGSGDKRENYEELPTEELLERERQAAEAVEQAEERRTA